MFGVLDETDTLKDGQVYVQYSENVNRPMKKMHTVKGTSGFNCIRSALFMQMFLGFILVSRSPCTGPGDVRIMFAVGQIPALSHLKDVIAFPSSGKRPHPDEMAGKRSVRQCPKEAFALPNPSF